MRLSLPVFLLFAKCGASCERVEFFKIDFKIWTKHPFSSSEKDSRAILTFLAFLQCVVSVFFPMAMTVLPFGKCLEFLPVYGTVIPDYFVSPRATQGDTS